MNFQIPLKDLCQLFSLYQERTEDNRGSQLKMVERKGGNKYFFHGLYTHPSKGIRKGSTDQRIAYYGSNSQTPLPPKSFWRLIYDALKDFILRVLIVASLLSMILQLIVAKPQDKKTSWIEGFCILIAVMICALVTAFNNYQKEKQFRKLSTISEQRKQYTVIRENETGIINQNDIVTGDILIVRQGMEVPVDGWLIDAAEVTVDQSSMTGETEPLLKDTLDGCMRSVNGRVQNAKGEIPSPILMSGTKVLTGQGKMICLVVGKNSCIGRVRNLIKDRTDTLTPLQTKLQTLASDIGKLGLIAATVIVLVLLIRFTIERISEKNWETSIHLPQVIDFFIIGITVIVVAIPEGLPLAVTLTLAYSIRKMLMDNNLVRRMEACQTMGGASIICSDKTGTLTMNKMNVVTWWNEKLHEVQCYSESRLEIYKQLHEKYQQLIQINLFINSSAELRPEQLGSSTEIALMVFGERLGGKYNKFREDYQILKRYPFNSNRKRMSILTEVNGQQVLMTKGASQIILSHCSSMIGYRTASATPIDTQTKAKIDDVIVKMAEKGLRTIALAYREIKPEDDITTKLQSGVYSIELSDLVLLAIFGVKDLPREEVPEAITQCRRSGIKVKMVTGDNIITATAIAKEIGIIQPNKPSLCLEGPEFNRIIGGVVCDMCRTEKCDCNTDPNDKSRPCRKDVIKNEEDFQRIVKNLDVLARSRPQDKYALVTGLINRGLVVAVTGDGTNDAPALKKADVGFAMGKSGTEIARQASSIVLLDDNFNSIVKAVLWGRNIYDCIKKFVQFQITVNIVAVTSTLLGAVVLRQHIFTPLQMLWLNMIMDTLASLALATQQPVDSLLDRKPYNRDEYIITKRMWKHIISQSIYQLLILSILIFLGQNFLPQASDAFDQVIAPNYHHKYKDGIVWNGKVVSGREWGIFNNKPDYHSIYEIYKVPSRHFTIIFNTFVMMQIFNFFNSRKLNDELNIFQGVLKSWIFLTIVLTITCLQVVIVSFGSIAFNLYSFYGLTPIQWVICIGFGSGSLIIGFLTKLFPQGEMCLDRAEYQQKPTRQNRSYLLAIRPRVKPIVKKDTTESESDQTEQQPDE